MAQSKFGRDRVLCSVALAGGHLVAILERQERLTLGEGGGGPGAACVQATWLCCSAVSESFWISGEDGADLAQELCSAGG